MKENAVTVDVVIVSFNTRELLRSCLDALIRYAPPIRVQVFVVDNASQDGSAAMVCEAFPSCQVIASPKNLGFGAANNLGIRAGSAPFVLCLNSDAELTPGALAELVHCLESDAQAFIAGPRLLNPDLSFQPSCRRFPNWTRNFAMYAGLTRRFPSVGQTWLREEEHQVKGAVDMVSGACFLARREYLELMGCFDENLFLFEEELDLMYPASRAGKKILHCPEARVVHHGGASVAGSQMSAFAERQLFRSKYYVFRKHYGRMYAWWSYASDCFLFGVSQVFARLRGKQGRGAQLLRAARRGWRESFLPASTLRDQREFFEDEKTESEGRDGKKDQC